MPLGEGSEEKGEYTDRHSPWGVSSESYRLDTLVLGSYVGEMSPTGCMEDCWDNGALGSLDSAHKEHAVFFGVCPSNCQSILPLPQFTPQPQASKHSSLAYSISQRGPESGDEKTQPQDAQTSQSRSREWAGLWHPFGALTQAAYQKQPRSLTALVNHSSHPDACQKSTLTLPALWCDPTTSWGRQRLGGAAISCEG